MESTDKKEYISVLNGYCEKVDVVYLPFYRSILNMLTNLSSRRPFQVAFYWSKYMKKLFKDVIERNHYDLIHVTLIRTMPYVEDVSDIPLVLDHIDALSFNMERRHKNEDGKLRKKLFEIEHRRMKEFESKYRQIPSIVTSETDKMVLDNYKNITVISNGVDVERFIYKSEEKLEKDKNIDMVFVGNMGYFPNIQAIEFFYTEIFPIIKKHKKDIKVYIVGANARKKVRSMADSNNIFVTGFVENVEDYLYRAKVFIAPLQSGSGIQNKILEAMACGIPVVSTSIGNSGIRGENIEEIIIADPPEEFAKMTLYLLENKKERERIALNARRLVERNFSWKSKGEELQRFYEEVLSCRE